MYVNYAHRGASQYAPENTRSAFRLGIEMKANGIELDLQKTADDKIVIFHNDRLDGRCNATGTVGEYTYDELCKFDFGSWFSESYKGEKIMLFEDFANEFMSNDLTFAIELKECGIARDTFDIIKKYAKNMDMVYVSSFNYQALCEMREISADIKLSYLTYDINDENIEKLLVLNGSQICPRADTVTDKKIEYARERGLEVRLWGVSNEEIMKKVYKMDIDGMTVNFPDKLNKLLG